MGGTFYRTSEQERRLGDRLIKRSRRDGDEEEKNVEIPL
jgi:hypothetical protein